MRQVCHWEISDRKQARAMHKGREKETVQAKKRQSIQQIQCVTQMKDSQRCEEEPRPKTGWLGADRKRTREEGEESGDD